MNFKSFFATVDNDWVIEEVAVVVDSHIIMPKIDFKSGFSLMLMTYFVFNAAFPDGCYNTMEFIQRQAPTTRKFPRFVCLPFNLLFSCLTLSLEKNR